MVKYFQKFRGVVSRFILHSLRQILDLFRVQEITNGVMFNLPDEIIKRTHVHDDKLKRFGGIVVNYCLEIKKLGNSFLTWTFWVGFRKCGTFVMTFKLIRLFPNHLHSPHIDIRILWNLCIIAYGKNTKQYHMPLANFCQIDLHYVTCFWI